MTRQERLIQLDLLEKYLQENDIMYERIDRDGYFGCVDTHQICVPCFDVKQRKWDAICHRGSFGYEEGLLEIMGSIVRADAGNEVEGFLTAEDVIKRIEERKEKES